MTYPKVAILLATYNPRFDYLEELISSLHRQENVEIRIYWSDDSNSKEIQGRVASLMSCCDNVMFYEGPMEGAKNNFFFLLNKVQDEDYVAFADQDDIWLSNRLISQISTLEGASSDSRLKGTFFSPYLLKSSSVQFREGKDFGFQQLLVHNQVQGCTLLITREAANFIVASPHAIMHDWWIALILKSKDALFFESKPLILYRIHDNNTVGLPSLKKKLSNFIRRPPKILVNQNRDFLNLYGDKMVVEHRRSLEAWLSIYDNSLLARGLGIFIDNKRRDSFLVDLGRRVLHTVKIP